MNYVTQGKMLIFFSSAYEYGMGEKVMEGKNHIFGTKLTFRRSIYVLLTVIGKLEYSYIQLKNVLL